ncbi:MAG TPA: iron ABC transporter permease [Dehalococcoidia bacterium]|nr:iron ABC transporter permease [Dehalococcoidia bacterium]
MLGFGCAALLGAMMISIAIGPVYIELHTVWESLWTHDGSTASTIVRDIRLPRVLIGAMVGASLAMSGAILQGVTRNPLADPHIFGISAGAGLVAVTATVFLPDLPKGTVQPIAFAGGFAGGGMAYAMAWRGGVSPVRLALAGIAVTSILTAITSGVLVTSAFSAQIGLRWLIGGLQQRNWDDFWLLLPYFVAGTLVMLLTMRQVNVISLGDELATSLGQHVERTRFVLAATAALLASAAVSIAGLVGFLGLIIPHLVRLVIGNDYRFVLPASALFGAILLVVADTAARTVLDPQELPVGILTAVMGGPVFILLVRSRA